MCEKLINQNKELKYIIGALLEYIDAIPSDMVAKFPAMPGISRDYVDEQLNMDIDECKE